MSDTAPKPGPLIARFSACHIERASDLVVISYLLPREPVQLAHLLVRMGASVGFTYWKVPPQRRISSILGGGDGSHRNDANRPLRFISDCGWHYLYARGPMGVPQKHARGLCQNSALPTRACFPAGAGGRSVSHRLHTAGAAARPGSEVRLRGKGRAGDLTAPGAATRVGDFSCSRAVCAYRIVPWVSWGARRLVILLARLTVCPCKRN